MDADLERVKTSLRHDSNRYVKIVQNYKNIQLRSSLDSQDKSSAE